MSREVIRVENIDKAFGDKLIFKAFSLSIYENEIHAIIGPNGAGKTSLLRILTGLYRPDSGLLKLEGSFSMLLENDYLYEDKTGLENIRQYGLYFDFGDRDYRAYSDFLGLSQDLDRRVSSYSKGMKRKLSLLLVLMMDRDIVFLDELTSGVDPISRVEMRRLLGQVKEEGKTIVITSHDLAEIEKIADRVTMIKEGQIIFTKDIGELAGQSLEDIFIEKGEVK